MRLAQLTDADTATAAGASVSGGLTAFAGLAESLKEHQRRVATAHRLVADQTRKQAAVHRYAADQTRKQAALMKAVPVAMQPLSDFIKAINAMGQGHRRWMNEVKRVHSLARPRGVRAHGRAPRRPRARVRSSASASRDGPEPPPPDDDDLSPPGAGLFAVEAA